MATMDLAQIRDANELAIVDACREAPVRERDAIKAAGGHALGRKALRRLLSVGVVERFIKIRHVGASGNRHVRVAMIRARATA